MTLRSKLTARVLLLVVALMLMGIFVTPGTPTVPATGPYQSALSNVGVGTARAAACNHRICEFVAPGYHCLFEGSATSCVRAPGGCTEIPCN